MIASSAARTPTLDEKKNDLPRQELRHLDGASPEVSRRAYRSPPEVAFCQMPTTFTLAGIVGYHIALADTRDCTWK